jgi:hypothetical protein
LEFYKYRYIDLGIEGGGENGTGFWFPILFGIIKINFYSSNFAILDYSREQNYFIKSFKKNKNADTHGITIIQDTVYIFKYLKFKKKGQY